MGIFFAAAVWPRGKGVRRLVAGLCAAAFLGATAYAGMRFFQVCHPEDTVPSVLADYRDGAGFEGMYEYEPPQGDISQIAMGLPDACLVSDPETEMGKVDDDTGNLTWTASQGSCLATFPITNGHAGNPEHLRLRADVPQAGFLVLRLLTYPAWTRSCQRRALGFPAPPRRWPDGGARTAGPGGYACGLDDHSRCGAEPLGDPAGRVGAHSRVVTGTKSTPLSSIMRVDGAQC